MSVGNSAQIVNPEIISTHSEVKKFGTTHLFILLTNALFWISEFLRKTAHFQTDQGLLSI